MTRIAILALVPFLAGCDLDFLEHPDQPSAFQRQAERIALLEANYDALNARAAPAPIVQAVPPTAEPPCVPVFRVTVCEETP